MFSPVKALPIFSIAIMLILIGTNNVSAAEIKNSRGEIITLDPKLKPSDNFDLTQWNISLPIDTNKDGIADTVPEQYLAKGFSIKPLFYTGEDGGMVFYAPSEGPKTSKNTKYTRNELREMLRGGNTRIKTQGMTKNNWGLSSVKRRIRKNLGAVGGKLEATVAVNYVTTTGDITKLGRVIIGQIHAKDDEPLRLYYRKMPNNTYGSIYMAHEPIVGEEQWYELIGGKASNVKDPENGIALDEVFSYRVEVVDSLLTVTIIRANKPDVIQNVDMSKSGYHKNNQYMYFKAGVYNQNNTADKNDYVQATFYQLENHHNKN